MRKIYQYFIGGSLVLGMLSLSLTGCAERVDAADLMQGISKSNVQLEQNISGEVQEALLDFSWNLLRETGKDSGNIMISAPSVYQALGMTLNGAAGETKEAMLKALSAQDLKLEDINAGLGSWNDLLLNKESKSKVDIQIANSIWVQKGYEVNPEFLQANKDYYEAGIRSLDFADPKAPETVNQWVKDKTKGTIDKIVEKMDPDLRLYLINAIYFKGQWIEPFQENSTYTGPFAAPSGSVEASFMRRADDIEFIQGKGAVGVVLPYEDERFAFVGLLPAEGQSPRDFIKETTIEDFLSLINTKQVKYLELSLPKFETGYENQLNDELTALGMGIAFEPWKADFTLMNKNQTRELYIGEVKHKTYIKIDEKGTEASAVTGVGVKLTSMPVDVTEVVFDRPFIYAIMDLKTGIPLFIGIMDDPTQE